MREENQLGVCLWQWPNEGVAVEMERKRTQEVLVIEGKGGGHDDSWVSSSSS